MNRTLLLDTCAALWTTSPDHRFERAQPRFREELGPRGRVLVSPITAWEVGLLVSRGRLALNEEPVAWFGALLERGIELAPLTPANLVQASFLPHSPLRDPGDQIMAATARALGCTLVTRDRVLLDYAEAGWIKALAC